MIVGALVFSGHNSGYDYVDRIVRAVVSGSLSFQPVDCRHFKGGFFLHDNIPCKAEDFYFRNETNDLLVLLSGYIYNREELCRKFRIHSGLSDPQLIAALYLQAGPGFVNALNGDYAIFILEQKKKLAFLFRDHVGIRPVAFINEGGYSAFLQI